jgi:S-adenosylmethionine:tRNA ribosyltransferase-isomerase
MSKKEKLQWKCMIGGASKWKEGPLMKKVIVQGTEVALQARLIEKLPDAYIVELSWQPTDFTFAEVIDQAGDTPLPPYIKRKAAASDKERYQTIYAKYEGSVAAPTAGLHFTPGIFASLATKEIATEYVTLHVGAGTFKPVKAAALEGHEMHAEWMDVTVANINALIRSEGNIISVGTTSLRTLESLYWMGVKSLLHPNATIEELMIHQWDVYEKPLSEINFSSTEAFEGLLMWMANHNSEKLISPTQILIAPGYQYRVIKAIITNFHQPQSTLLLLVAAAIGDDWRKLYTYAMENDFRFLSYGDGSLLFLREKN